jgi:hypothetical protein
MNGARTLCAAASIWRRVSHVAMLTEWRYKAGTGCRNGAGVRRSCMVIATVLAVVTNACVVVSSKPSAQVSGQSRPSPQVSDHSAPNPARAPTTNLDCKFEVTSDVHVQGCVTITDGGNLDLDRGQANVTTYDVGLRQGIIFPATGTSLAYLGIADFRKLSGPAILQAVRVSSNYSLNALERNGVFAVSTGQGRSAKVRLDSITTNTLAVSFVTYASTQSIPQPPPPVSPAPSLRATAGRAMFQKLSVSVPSQCSTKQGCPIQVTFRNGGERGGGSVSVTMSDDAGNPLASFSGPIPITDAGATVTVSGFANGDTLGAYLKAGGLPHISAVDVK